MSLDHIPGQSSLLELPRMLADTTGFLEERHRRFGDVFRTRFLIPVVFLVGPEANKAIHVTRRDAFSYRQGFRWTAFGRLFGGSMILEDGDDHRRDRSVLQPSMGRLALADSLVRVRAIWERAVSDLGDGRSRDVHALAQSTTFEVSANALLGLELEEDLGAYRPLFESLIDGAMASLPWRFPGGRLDRGLRAREELIRRLAPRIEAARGAEPKGMLGLLAHHREADGTPITTRRIAEHLLLLFWAGYETTASTGAWVLYELAREPAWQERLWREQERVLSGRALSMDLVPRLLEHGWVLKEIERLRPAGVFFPRGVVEDVELLGHRVPKDLIVFYSPYLTHRMPDLFPEPDRFRPARWDPAGGERVAAASALVGFGGGPRICLGKAFALMQLQVMLCSVLSRYRLELDADHAASAQVLPLYRPKNAFVYFRPRVAPAAAERVA